ncbi:MAG: hypothetical protein HKP49_04675 [Maribacter sp.]|nr:hypothetical protein [Maribacter sp.]
MRTQLFVAMLFLIFSVGCKGQTPEQKKQIEEMQKNAEKMQQDMEKKGMEAQRQYDSIMNTPQVKKIMQQTEAMEAQAKIDRDKRAAEKQEKVQKPNIPKKDYDEYLVSKGNTKKFDNWAYGEADIMMGGFATRITDPGYYKKIGTVKADGSFNLQLPAIVDIKKNGIANSRWLSCGYFGDKGKIEYSNTNTGVKVGYIQIKKNENLVGLLSIASSVELIEGWNPIQGHYHDIPGYRLEWFYVTGETSVKGQCVKENRYGEGKDFDITTVFDMQLKPGWNLLKREYDGPRIFVDWGEGEHNKHSYYKEEKITVAPSMLSNAKWIFRAN